MNAETEIRQCHFHLTANGSDIAHVNRQEFLPQVNYVCLVWSPIAKLLSINADRNGPAMRWASKNCSLYARLTRIQTNLGRRGLDDQKADASLILVYKIVNCWVAVSFPGYISSSNRLNWHKHRPHFVHISTCNTAPTTASLL